MIRVADENLSSRAREQIFRRGISACTEGVFSLSCRLPVTRCHRSRRNRENRNLRRSSYGCFSSSSISSSSSRRSPRLLQEVGQSSEAVFLLHCAVPKRVSSVRLLIAQLRGMGLWCALESMFLEYIGHLLLSVHVCVFFLCASPGISSHMVLCRACAIFVVGMAGVF